MRFWKPLPVFASATAAVAALAVMLFVRPGFVDALIMILIATALIGMYLLRRYARAELLYRSRSEPEWPLAGRTARPGRAVPAQFTLAEAIVERTRAR